MMIMEASRDSYPREFGAFLRAENNIIYEIALLPGTIQGDKHTIFQSYSKPIDFQLVGSVHSHPSGNVHPSEQDISMFSNSGDIHIIVGYPYTPSSYAAYNRKGNAIEIKII